jgi:hypothetical protein
MVEWDNILSRISQKKIDQKRKHFLIEEERLGYRKGNAATFTLDIQIIRHDEEKHPKVYKTIAFLSNGIKGSISCFLFIKRRVQFLKIM